MKLLYVTGGLPHTPGEAFIIPEVLELRRRGHAVTIVPLRPNGPVVHRDAQQLIPVSIVRPVVSPAIIGQAVVEAIRAPLRTLRALGELLRSRSIRILLKNASVFPKALWLASVIRRIGAEHVHAHWAGTSASAAFIASQVAGVPWSFTAHRWDIPEDNLIAAKARTASFVRAIDVRGGEELKVRMGDAAGRLVVVHMGVALPEFRERPPAPVHQLRVIMGAYFFEKKGHRYAIEAIGALRQRGVPVELELAGDGPLEREIAELVEARGARSSVRFLGVLSHEELLAGFSNGRWDVALLPSIVTADGEREGIPVFLMEAMASGVPVVATATGGIPELVDGAGVLVEPRSAVGIADALERLYQDPAERCRLAAAGRAKVTREFEIGATVDRLVELFGGPRRA